MSTLRQDVQQTLRNMRGAPVFFGAVILTLAIGIGANTALFSIVRTVLLDPLPYPDSDQLVAVAENPWNPAEIALDLRESGRSFQEIAAYSPQPFAVTGGEQPYELEGAKVTPNFFRTLGAGMARGRGFTAEDGRPGAPPVAIVSYGVWQSQFGGRADIVGQTIRLDDKPHQIVGVMERGFRVFAPRSEDPSVWTASEIMPPEDPNEMTYVIPLARLKPGVPLQRAQAELDQAMVRFRERHPDRAAEDAERWSLRLATVKSEMVKEVRTALVLLQLTVGVLLLIACVNVANLLLARSTSRQREMAIRSALGASRGRLIRRLMTESVVLAILGGLSGLALMALTLQLVLRAAPADIPRIDEVSIDLPVFVFALGISGVTGLLFGVIPAFATVRRSIHDHLKEGGRSPTRSSGQHRVSQALVVTEVTLTLVLLVGAGLLVRSFFLLTGQETGFRTDDVLTVAVQVPASRHDSVPQLEEFYRRSLERLAQVPGVQAVGVANNLPINRNGSRREYLAEGDPETAVKEAQYAVVSPGYFRALDLPLVRGRYFEDTDRRGAPRVAIVDEAMARVAFPGQDPIGKRFRFEDGGDEVWLTVVGLARNIRGSGLAKDPGPGFYISYQQRPPTQVELRVGRKAVFLVRSQLDAEALAEPLRKAIWEVDPQQPVAEIRPLASIVAEEAGPQRFRATLLGTFAAIALVLVLVGVYGVIEYLVAERTQEFGIRMALGAPRGNIVGNVVAWALKLTVIGGVLGMAGVFVLNRYLTSMLFGITPTDPLTIGGSLLVIGAITLAACFIPARRATQVDPIVALRSERLPVKLTARVRPAGIGEAGD